MGRAIIGPNNTGEKINPGDHECDDGRNSGNFLKVCMIESLLRNWAGSGGPHLDSEMWETVNLDR